MAATSNGANAMPCSSTSTSIAMVETNSVAASLPRISLKQLCQIKSGGYFDLVAQIIGIFNCRESDRRILRVWDGTQPFIAITRIPQVLESLPSGSYFAPLQDFLIRNQPKLIADIYVYDEHMPLCDTVKPGDIIHLRNLHSFWPKYVARGSVDDTITMHKDGGRFNRGLTRLESTHPESVKLMSDLCKIFSSARALEIRHFTNPLSPPFVRSASSQPSSVASAATSGSISILAGPQRTPPRVGLANDQRPSASTSVRPLTPPQNNEAASIDSTGQLSPRRSLRFVSPQTNRNLLRISDQLPASSRQIDPAIQDAAPLAIAIQPCALNGESSQWQNSGKAEEHERTRKLPTVARIRRTLRPNPASPVANAEGIQVIVAERLNRAPRAKERRRRLRIGFELLIAARKIPKGTEEVHAPLKIVTEAESELLQVSSDDDEATLAGSKKKRKRKLEPVSLSSSSISNLTLTEVDNEDDFDISFRRRSDRLSAKKAALGAKKG